MSYTPPKLSELIKQSLSDFDDVASQTLLIEAVSNAVAAQAYGLYGYIEYLSRQIVPHLADEDYLIKFCTFWGVWRKSKSQSTGYLKLTLTGSASLDTGTQFQNASGVIIESTDSVISSDSEVLVPVQSIEYGADTNCAQGTEFELISPVSNVESKATVATGGLTGGANIESVESLRSRLLFRVQYPPSGGNKYDYVRWARECSGVTRAWCIPAPFNTNYVTVLFTLDDQTNITPTDTDIQRVSEYIEGHVNEITNQFEGKPSGSEIIVKAPIFKEINPSISIRPNKSELRAPIKAALTSYLYGIEVGNPVYLSQLIATISNVTGVVDCDISNVTENINANSDELITLGTITWL